MRLWYFLLIPALLFASTGSISGYVCDINGNPLIGATVMVVGTNLGAMTEPDGFYLIDDLEPGTYALQARMVGMGQRIVQGIVVYPNLVTQHNFGEPGAMYRALQSDTGCGRILVSLEDSTSADLPLVHTSAEIKVTGNIQSCVVTQTYTNPYESPIESVYVFPLPNDGAVSSMNVYIGEQLIQGHVYEKEDAFAIYESAIDEGRTAALLVQERPNVFTQQLGNILPSDSILVEITYTAPIKQYENEYEIVFPMVVPPKYIPGETIGQGERGWSDPTTLVPDADRINPLVFPEGMRSSYDIDLSVEINAGIPVSDFISVNHEVLSVESNEGIKIQLAGEDVIPNRDFVLRYTLESDEWQAGLLATNESLGGHFMLVLQPEAELIVEEPQPREYFFVVDCSGSMSGQPMAVAKETMRHFMRSMSTEDTFQIIRFSNTASSFSETPIPATRRNVNLGLAYVELMSGTGGTEMLNGVRAALGYPEDPDLSRYVIFLTDGQIGNEAAVMEEVRNILGSRTLLWSVGIGSSPNRFLLDGLAEEGHGRSFYVGLQEDPTTVAERIGAQIAGSYIHAVSIDWGDLRVSEVFPEEMPNLYAGEALFITGRFQGGGRDYIELNGKIGDENWREALSVVLPYDSDDNQGIASAWARQKIHQLERYLLDAESDEESSSLITEITATALKYQILSNYTSFVAVTEEIRADDLGNPITVEVPVNMPEGQSYEGTFGGNPGGLAPEAVGSTVITTCDMRGPVFPDYAGSVSTSSGSDQTSTFVAMERDRELRSDSGIMISILSLMASSGLSPDDMETLSDSLLDAAAEVADRYGSYSEGLIILRLTVAGDSGSNQAELVQNFTESTAFGEELIEEVALLPLSEMGLEQVTFEIALEFAN